MSLKRLQLDSGVENASLTLSSLPARVNDSPSYILRLSLLVVVGAMAYSCLDSKSLPLDFFRPGFLKAGGNRGRELFWRIRRRCGTCVDRAASRRELRGAARVPEELSTPKLQCPAGGDAGYFGPTSRSALRSMLSLRSRKKGLASREERAGLYAADAICPDTRKRFGACSDATLGRECRRAQLRGRRRGTVALKCA